MKRTIVLPLCKLQLVSGVSGLGCGNRLHISGVFICNDQPKSVENMCPYIQILNITYEDGIPERVKDGLPDLTKEPDFIPFPAAPRGGTGGSR